MARPISWLQDLQVIRRSVSNSVRSHYDRRDLELLFKLQPSAANKLAELLPTVPVGQAHMVEREALERFLDEVAASDNVPALLTGMRKTKAATTRRKLRRLTRYDLEPIPIAALPDRIKLSRGHMEIDFADVRELAEGMLMLAGILHHNLDQFIDAYEPPSAVRDEDLRGAIEIKALFEDLRRKEQAMRENGKYPGQQTVLTA